MSIVLLLRKSLSAISWLLNEVQRNKLREQNITIIIVSGLAIVSVMIFMFFYRHVRQKQKLQELKLKALNAQQQVEILQSKIQGEEQERRRISRELHDGVASLVFSIIMRVSLLKRQKAVTTESTDLDEILSLLEDTGKQIRKTAHNLLPEEITNKTFKEAVTKFCETVSKGTTTVLDVQFHGDDPDFPEKIKINLYRLIQELVYNILKHAKATHAIVQIIRSDDQCSITIEDNGIGFDPQSKEGGIGLKSVRSRVEDLGGELDIQSKPGEGTTFYIQFSCAINSKF